MPRKKLDYYSSKLFLFSGSEEDILFEELQQQQMSIGRGDGNKLSVLTFAVQ